MYTFIINSGQFTLYFLSTGGIIFSFKNVTTAKKCPGKGRRTILTFLVMSPGSFLTAEEGRKTGRGTDTNYEGFPTVQKYRLFNKNYKVSLFCWNLELDNSNTAYLCIVLLMCRWLFRFQVLFGRIDIRAPSLDWIAGWHSVDTGPPWHLQTQRTRSRHTARPRH